ncbi:type II secretion system protein [Candidatus Sumerlaeota bacterium]|nr:type II secretion system protein [Candidatus Sumerlaeota bacterium]
MRIWRKYHRQKGMGYGFILLEVILSMMILGIAIAALMRSFTTSLATVRKAQIVTTASLLAQQILEEYEVIPPQGDHAEGDFSSSLEDGDFTNDAQTGSDPYKYYYWVVDLEEIEVDYPDFSLKGESDEMENLTKITVSIIYNDGRLKQFTPIRVETYLTTSEKFTYDSKRENKLY